MEVSELQTGLVSNISLFFFWGGHSLLQPMATGVHQPPMGLGFDASVSNVNQIYEGRGLSHSILLSFFIS